MNICYATKKCWKCLPRKLQSTKWGTEDERWGELREEDLRPEEVQIGLHQIVEMLAEMLAKVEVSLKTDIAAVRADIGQVLGRVEEIGGKNGHIR